MNWEMWLAIIAWVIFLIILGVYAPDDTQTIYDRDKSEWRKKP